MKVRGLEKYKVLTGLLAYTVIFLLPSFPYCQVSAVKQAKVEVLQLRQEASLTRINVSQAVEDIKVNLRN